jgi:molybdate transport system substrate-binding protein
MVKEGAPKPDISTVEAFKQTLLKAKSVGYIDPASGGSSGIYVAGLLDKLGIAEQIKPKAKLQKGGHVSDLVKAGEAEIGIHQNSEIVGQAGVTLIGPLPKDIQNYTTYAVGLGSGAKQAEAAKAFIKVLTGPSAAAVLKAAGMEGA